MLTRTRSILLIIPVLVGIALYPVSFQGKQVVSLDAPLQATFDVLVDHLWQFHPFVVQIDKLEQINDTCAYYRITDRIPFIPSMKIDLPSTYFVRLNTDREKACLTSEVHTQLSVMQAYHQYCLHTNTLKPTTTIITDQFQGTSWLIFKSYIRASMFQSHKSTLEKLRKEMLIYASD